MKLFLMQHGEASAQDIDPERPLTAGGQADVARLADFLARAGVRAARVIHSGKLRAAQSAAVLAARIAPGVELETSGRLNPNDNTQAFDWRSGSGDADTLIVGHLPFLARLVAQLVTGDERRALTAFRPGSMVCLEPDADGHWLIAWMIRPELLAS